MIDQAPALDVSAAELLAREHFGLTGRAESLTSERDQNFLLTVADGTRVVLKVANALEDRPTLEAQQAAMRHLAEAGIQVPHVIPAANGDTLHHIVGKDGRQHMAWAVSFIGGSVLAHTPHRSAELLTEYGTAIGRMTSALTSFDDAALHRDFHWDLANGRAVIAQHRSLVTDDALGAAIVAVLRSFEMETAPLLSRLSRSVVHNDLNDHNVLVSGGRVSGFVDFGDMVHSYTISDVAIAAAYVALDSATPLADMAALVRGHHASFPFTEDEIAALFGLISLRLATSACLAAAQRVQVPDNEYLDVSQSAIRRVLPALAAVPVRLATAIFREACGLEPVESSARVRSWLARNTAAFAAVVDADLRVEPSTVLDLSIGSPFVSGDAVENTEPYLTRRIAELQQANGTRFAIGRYDEPRLLYAAPFFAAGAATGDERRTVHIGLDVFADAGTPVFAPLDGTVHAFADNPELQDYGPVIVLRHVTDDGDVFHTLYGHLSRASLDGLSPGKPVARGERFAWFGTADVNVGWTPHLHFQVITDDLDLGTDFAGVAPASQRAVWRSLSPDPNLIVGVPASFFPPERRSKEESLARRRSLLSRNLSVAYGDPLVIARGWMQYLYDDEGRRYLDAYNNVPHVGHCHPRVVRAAREQMGVLSTNTRYLDDRLATYAERLIATLPQELSVCVVLNSASEANELALRMARAYTGARDMIVLDAAYHGNTTSLIDISPYKHAGPGGGGPPDWVHVAPLPDTYRGRFRRDDDMAGVKYAAEVKTLSESRRLAGFIAETCPSVGGQLLLPPGYLTETYRHVREAGGVCIADEVQTGLGRMGTHFWAFEAHAVVPDIVVMGKPLGNGYPLAAVVTTRAIADAFDNGMEFFSTFGGNNVASAVGLEVLDVVRDEALQAHALDVGERLLAGLRSLAADHEIIGDVRGSGLFLGIELVKSRETLEPAADEASRIANRMRERGILLGTDGPYHNVVKIRPPMPFNAGDADKLVDALAGVLMEQGH